MATLTVESLGSDFAQIKNPIVIEDTPKSRLILHAQMHSGGIRGDLVRYRKNPDGSCAEITKVNFNTLHPDDSIKIPLDTKAMKNLLEALWLVERVQQENGVSFGVRRFEVTNPDSLIISDQNKIPIIKKLIEANYSNEVWAQIVQADPDLATRLANSKVQENRISALRQFDSMLSDPSVGEDAWQHFFEDETWIFGYGLRYQFLNIVEPQPHYGGMNVTGSGEQRGDFLTATEAETRFTCLVEIKRPDTSLLHNQEYRNGAWSISRELAGAISQIQVNSAQWELYGSKTEENRELLEGINTIMPKGIVIAGLTSELDSAAKKNSFERFRRNLNNPEIITYDELYERAKFIVEGYEN